MLKGRNKNEREEIQKEEAGQRQEAAPHLQLHSYVLSVTPGGGWTRAHACEHMGLAAEPPCQCKHASPGMEMSWLLSPLAAQDLQAFEMQD